MNIGISLAVTSSNSFRFSPPALSGLTGWWRGDLGVTTATGVSSWANQGSGGGSFAQAAGGNQPALVSSNINGQPGLRFNGSSHYMGGPLTSALITASAGTLFLVYRPISISRNVASPIYSNDGILTDVGAYWGFSAQNSAGGLARGVNFDGSYDEPTALAITAGTACLLEWVHSGGNVSIRKNGGAANSTASGDTTVTQLTRFGAGYNNTFFGNFDCCEIITFNRALSTVEGAAVRSYVSERYAITMA